LIKKLIFLLILTQTTIFSIDSSSPESQYELIKNILCPHNETVEYLSDNDYQKLYDVYKQLILIGTDEAINLMLSADDDCLPDDYLKCIFDLPMLLKKLLTTIPSKRNFLYDEIFNNQTVHKIEKFYYLVAIDKYRCYDDIIKFYQSDPDKNIHWLLLFFEKMKDKRTIPVLETLSTDKFFYQLNIAAVCCGVNYHYKENLDLLLNTLLNRKDNNYSDLILPCLQGLADPEVLDRLGGTLKDIRRLSGDWGFDAPEFIEILEARKKYIHYHHITTNASSTLKAINKHEFYYDTWNLLDEDDFTAWVEGVENDGIDEWVEFAIDTSYEVTGFEIMNGYAKDNYVFTANNRVKKLEVQFPDGSDEVATLKDTQNWQKIEFPAKKTNNLKFVIKDIYKGSKYSDTCISNIRILKNIGNKL